jgi:hypothetical protein
MSILWLGLPDGIFSKQKSQFGSILEGLAMGMLVYFTAIRSFLSFCIHIFWLFCYILWFFGIFFSRFGTLYQEKSGNPDCDICN